MLVSEAMRRSPKTLSLSATCREAALAFDQAPFGTVLVVANGDLFVGVLATEDLMSAALPSLDEALAAGGSVNDTFRAFLARAQELSDRSVEPFVLQDCLTIGPDQNVAQAATLLADRKLGLLPVVEDGRLVGSISRSDVCRAVIVSP